MHDGRLAQRDCHGREGIAAVGDVSEHIGYYLADMQPIGGSESQTDVWLIGRPGYPGAGRVLWFWGIGL